MPIKSGTLQFIQEAHKEALNGLIKNIIENPLVDTIYILSGCVNSGTLPNYDISAGVLYVNGEIFDFDGALFTTTGLQKAYARIETTQYVTNADPVQFTDGVNRNVHNIRKIVIENTITSSGLPEFINFINVGRWKESDTVLQNQINVLKTYTPKNIGFFSGLDVSTSTGSLTTGGDITLAIATTGTEESFVACTMANTMPNMNYYILMTIESLGTVNLDNDIYAPIFKKISTTQFQFSIREITGSSSQNLKVHFQVISF